MTQRTLSKHSESNQREREQSDFVIPSEPKILHLVSKIKGTSLTKCPGKTGHEERPNLVMFLDIRLPTFNPPEQEMGKISVSIRKRAS